jgi:hypothetical protein
MRRRGPTVQVGRQGPGLVGTMARTAVIAGTATATVGATKAVMGGGSKQAAAQQQSMTDQQIADLQAQQDQLAVQQAALAQQQAAAQPAAAQPAAASQVPAGPAPDSLDAQAAQIRQLAQMKEQGLITDEEFQAKKKQILGI